MSQTSQFVGYGVWIPWTARGYSFLTLQTCIRRRHDMKDQKKTKSQLIDELETLRLKVAPLEGSRTGVAWASDLGERQYQQIFEALTDALLVTDREGRIVEGNPAACRMYGYKYDELVGMNATGLVHPDGRCIFEESLESSTPGEVFRTEAIDVRKDGSAFPVEVGCGRHHV